MQELQQALIIEGLLGKDSRCPQEEEEERTINDRVARLGNSINTLSIPRSCFMANNQNKKNKVLLYIQSVYDVENRFYCKKD